MFYPKLYFIYSNKLDAPLNNKITNRTLAEHLSKKMAAGAFGSATSYSLLCPIVGFRFDFYFRTGCSAYIEARPQMFVVQHGASIRYRRLVSYLLVCHTVQN